MLYTHNIQRAIRFSIKTHEVYQKQKRKGKDIPYIIHPLTVGLILARTGAHEDVVIAGILHDTIEDSIPEKKVSRALIARYFSEHVAELVESVTENTDLSTWEERKEHALEATKSYSPESLLVKSADLISNGSEIVDDWHRNGDSIFLNFHASKEKMIVHYLRMIWAIIGRSRENPLVPDLEHVAEELRVILHTNKP